MQSTSNSNTLHSYFTAKKPELNQTNLTLLNNLEQLIKMPLQDLLLDEIVQDLEEFRRSCSGAREYLNKIRLESRDIKDQGKGESQSVLICRHLLQILKTFLEETLARILTDWEKTLNKGAPSSARLDCTKMMIQITSVGLEMTFSGVTLVCNAVGKKQKIEEEVSLLVTLFRKLSETVLTRPSMMLLGEYQTMVGDNEQSGEGGKIIQTLERVYKEVWKLIFLLKKLNLFGDQADSLLNVLEIALVQLIDSSEISHNVLGYEVAMTIFTLTDNEYYVSLINVVSSWNRKAQLNNIGKLYQILFLYANEQVRDKILCEVEGLEPIEMLRFLELFDTKMYEGFLEGGLLFQEGSNIIHNPNMLVEKLGLTKNLTLKLQRIMNERVHDELLKSTDALKNQGYSHESPERRRYIALLKISSIAMNNAIFLKDGACAKLYDALLLLTDEYLSNPEAHGTHYVQIQIMIDIVHGMHEMTANTFEQIVDLTAKSENVECQLFAAKFGNIIHNVTHENGDGSQKIILEKVGGIYHSMLDSEDFLLKFKAVEGIMLAANNSTLGQEDLAVIVPPRDEDKDLLRKIANPSQEASKRVGANISKEFIEVVGGRLAAVQEDNNQMKEKFNKIKKDYPYELGLGGQEKDDEIEKAYKIFEETIKDLKETTLSPRAECRKLQLRNKMNALMNMLQG